MTDTAIKVENLSKRYRIGLKEELPETFVEAATNFITAPIRNFRQLRALSRFENDGQRSNVKRSNVKRSNDDVIWALRDVSFEVERGEVVGIIGRNGAGKSTLLKILSRITHPTSGRVELNGRVSSLLEVGTGFHQELTGRENIYLNGTILGMTKAEVDRKFDEIVAFSGVEKFIDTPVKRYSSGMRVRLAFSVAAHLEPEILLIDEVLAVGDILFQNKCLGKMDDVAKSGRTVLFVSHNMTMISSLCKRVILFNEGGVWVDGPMSSTIESYVDLCGDQAKKDLAEITERRGNGVIRFTQFVLMNESDDQIEAAFSGQNISLGFRYEFIHSIPVEAFAISIGFRDEQGRILFMCPSYIKQTFSRVFDNKGYFICHIPNLPLPPGTYRFNLFSTVNGEIADWIHDAGKLDVLGGDYYGTGRLPPKSHKGLLVEFDWEHQSI